ncbi:DsbA family oxidoreductase [Glycomyces sp. L485]|nr:DsbA family oxidoreductase [Glycomyces sp. L485]MCH7230208.1 DsbA family oxidoreductase [Glycomyces sp. L485]
MTEKLRVDIWSDIVCPWCYVGKARFDKAVEQFAHRDDVEIRLRSFELDPSHGTEDTVQVTSMLSKKYGMSPQQAQDGEYRLRELAAAEGLEYQAEGREVAGTFDVHRVLHLAADRGLAEAAWKAFYAANFAEEASLFKRERIIDVAVSAGLEKDEVTAVIDDPEPATPSAPTSPKPPDSAPPACRSLSSTASTASPAPSPRRCSARSSTRPGAKGNPASSL